MEPEANGANEAAVPPVNVTKTDVAPPPAAPPPTSPPSAPPSEPEGRKTTKIGYYDPQDVFPDLKDELLKRLPLTNIHWNPGSSRPLRSIPSLDVDLVEEQAKQSGEPPVKPHQMLGLSNNPYLKIILVKCEDNDMYRSTIRRMIREWLSQSVLSIRDPTEWLIIHYVPPGTKAYSGNRFRSGVFDKIRNDFNISSSSSSSSLATASGQFNSANLTPQSSSGKKDRCIQIRGDVPEAGTPWSTVISKIKDGILEAFSKRVELYKEEINKLEAKKDVMGWNFGTFFVMKEGLALSFENIGLFDDALLIYDELESSFGQLSTQHSVAFYASVGFDEDGNSTIPPPLLQISNSETIRHAIMSNTVSLFDFYCYLFARQASLLLYMARDSKSGSIASLKVGEMYARLKLFMTEMDALLATNKKSALRAAEWSYGIVEELLAAGKVVEDVKAPEVSLGRGEMFLSLRKSVSTLAANHGWLLRGPLTEVSLRDDDTSNDSTSVYEPTKDILKESLASEEAFQKRFIELTTSASSEFSAAQKPRIVSHLTTQLAFLQYQQGNYAEAAQILKEIAKMYSHEGWDLMSSHILSIYLECLEQLAKGATDASSYKREIFVYSLELLRKNKYLTDKETDTLLANVLSLASLSDYEVALDSWFEASIKPDVLPVPESHGHYAVSVDIKNSLHRNISLDYATLVLVRGTEKLTFRCESPSIESGETTLRLVTNRVIYGVFKLEKLKLVTKKLTFTKDFTPDKAEEESDDEDDDDEEPSFHLYPSPDLLWTEVRLQNTFTVTERKLDFVVHIQPNHHLQMAKLRLMPVSPHLKFDLAAGEAYFKGGDTVTVKYSAPSLEVTVPETDATTLHIIVPVSSDYDQPSLTVKATMDYTTPQGTFQLSYTEEIDVALAIDVNVLDFFKTKRLFSKFSVACKDKLQPVRVAGVTLDESEHYAVSSPVSPKEPLTSFPGNPVSYAFAIDRKPGLEQPESLTLRVRYRPLAKEFVVLLWNRLESKLAGSELRQFQLVVGKALSSLKVDIWMYGMEGALEIGEEALDRFIEDETLGAMPNKARQQLVKAIGSLDLTLSPAELKGDEGIFDDITHELVLPVAIPEVHVIHGVCLTLPDASHFVIGKTIDVVLSIRSFQTWAPTTDSPHLGNIQFTYEITAPHDSWAISGKRKSLFQIDGVETEQVPISFSMIALRPGKLPLPRVEISISSLGGSASGPIKMELDFENGSETALIVPESDRISVTF